MVSFRIRRLEHFGRTLPEKSCRLAGYAETAGFLRYTRQQRHIDFLYVSAPLCFSQLRIGHVRRLPGEIGIGEGGLWMYSTG